MYIQHTVKTTPLLKDLYELISPNFGAEWKVIGTCLGLPIGELNIIEVNHPSNARYCCNKMLEKWLEMDPSASWEKLFTAIELPAVSNQPATSMANQAGNITYDGNNTTRLSTISVYIVTKSVHPYQLHAVYV